MARTSRRYRGGDYSRGYSNVEGIDNAVRKLRAIGERVLDSAKAALKDGADMVVSDAKSRVPVRTGALKNSIMAKSLEDGAAYEISANAKNKKGIPYGQFVEWSPKIAKPFLYPAMDAQRDSVNNHVKQSIQNAIQGN